MKYKFFKQRIKLIIELYSVLSDRDIRLEKALGGDTSIFTNDAALVVDKMVDSLSKEMNDKNDIVSELIFDNLMSVDYSKENTILINDKRVPATIKKVWKELTKNSSFSKIERFYIASI